MSAYFESLNRRISTPAIASAPAQLPTPAADPVVAPRPRAIRVPAPRLAPGAVSATYATLRERLMLASQGKSLKSLVFAGVDGGEGCSQIVREFAETLASAGLNVLLVDGDLRTSGLTTSTAARHTDLAELVRSNGTPHGTAWGRGRLSVVSSPTGLGDKETFLRSPELARWLDTQRATFDYTFLDSPPILRHADGTLASLLCDGVVLVAKAGVTRGDGLARAREQLERAGGKVFGAVLTQVRNPVPVFLRRYLATE